VAGDDHEAVTNQAIRYLMDKYSPGGNRIGWLMIASIFVEAWDLYSISFINVFLTHLYHPSSLLLGLTSAGTQAGAAVGALIGGWLSDKLGRRAVFLGTMIMFIIFGAAQAFAPNMMVLGVIRFFLGIPLGSDIANGYTYIMEALPKGKREVMGNRWQFMFAFGEVIAGAVVALMYGLGLSPSILWRVALGLSAVPALVLFLLRFNLPETAVWLIQRGKFREARKVTMSMYGDPLAMLPDNDVQVQPPRVADFLADIWKDATKRRATLFGWISCAMQGLEFSTFAFYLPVLFVLVGVSGIMGTNLISIGLYILAAISGLVGPQITPRIGQRKLSIYGFGMVAVALIVTAIALHAGVLWIVPVAAAVMLWGHYWDAENCMTISSMVAAPRYRGTAAGFAYIFVKIPSFLGILLFPTFFDAIGKANATLFTAIFPVVGLLAAIFIFREVYGYSDVPAAAARTGTVPGSPGR
jgi:MFS family permease